MLWIAISASCGIPACWIVAAASSKASFQADFSFMDRRIRRVHWLPTYYPVSKFICRLLYVDFSPGSSFHVDFSETQPYRFPLQSSTGDSGQLMMSVTAIFNSCDEDLLMLLFLHRRLTKGKKRTRSKRWHQSRNHLTTNVSQFSNTQSEFFAL